MKCLIFLKRWTLNIIAWMLISFTSHVYASNCPIIFVHGHEKKALPEDGWGTWRNYYSAMKRILREEYSGYTAGAPLECHKNTNLSATGGNTKKIYSFSYYHPDGSKGVIGSNGQFTSASHEAQYEDAISGGSWAQNLANFIDEVRSKTGASKVDIVAHSMGGLVARAAITYYGCVGKVRKLIMIGTPNDEFQSGAFLECVWGLWEDVSGGYGWMRYGELLEMGLSPNVLAGGELFDDGTATYATWCDWLGLCEPSGIEMVTISGNRGLGFPPGLPSNDELVLVEQVKLDGGIYNPFNPTIYASHTYQGSGLEELSEVTCTYTTEFIKKWMIDDEIIAGAQPYVVQGMWDIPTVYPRPWDPSMQPPALRVWPVEKKRDGLLIILMFSFTSFATQKTRKT